VVQLSDIRTQWESIWCSGGSLSKLGRSLGILQPIYFVLWNLPRILLFNDHNSAWVPCVSKCTMLERKGTGSDLSASFIPPLSSHHCDYSVTVQSHQEHPAVQSHQKRFQYQWHTIAIPNQSPKLSGVVILLMFDNWETQGPGKLRNFPEVT
jgi:hypothetical protein